MIGMKATYENELHCMIEHEPSGSVITTDAPKDNHGKGESFSPTDLLGAALSSCILTTMGIYANKENIDLCGAVATVTKGMASNPRRVAELPVKVFMPSGIPEEKRQGLENAARNCPVAVSLSKDIVAQMEFEYRETPAPRPTRVGL